MIAWHDLPIVSFDVETTGVDVENDRIVTAAIAVCGGGEQTQAFEWLADPGVEIPEEASAVHGVTTERARAEGEKARDVIASVLATLRLSLMSGRALVVFNARFDLTILDREARRYGLEPLAGVLVVDPLVIDKHLDRFRKGSRKLDAICAHYRAELTDAHTAGADAIAAARVAWRIGKSAEPVRRIKSAGDRRELEQLRIEWEEVRHDLPALHAAQVQWADQQAQGLQAYFDGKGQTEIVERAWPLVPVPLVPAGAGS